MIAQEFHYTRAASLEEALTLLADGEAKVLAGGMSLIPMMKLRLAAAEHLVDLGRVPGLAGITEADGRIRIGAMTTHYAVESSSLVRSKCPLLSETASWIGDVQIRNTGTVGGSVAHADPSSDYPAALLALDANVHVVSKAGGRTLPYSEFLVDTFTTALEPGELVEAIDVPIEALGVGVSYQKMVHPASGFAMVGVAVRHTATGTTVGITGVGAKAYRAAAVETALQGGTSIEEAAKHATDLIEANSDLLASSAYRRQMAQVYCARALRAALGKPK